MITFHFILFTFIECIIFLVLYLYPFVTILLINMKINQLIKMQTLQMEKDNDNKQLLNEDNDGIDYNN